MAKDCIIVVPIYAKQPSENEVLALRSLLQLADRYPICLAAPASLDTAPYLVVLPTASVSQFADKHFKNVEAYSKLTASVGFYGRFWRYRFMLLIQTDAAVFSTDLQPWLGKGYSYVGAPWTAQPWLTDVQAYARKRWHLPESFFQPAG